MKRKGDQLGLSIGTKTLKRNTKNLLWKEEVRPFRFLSFDTYKRSYWVKW